MNATLHRPALTTGEADTRIRSQDRFARTDGRPLRSQPLMRTIEVASLLPDFTTTTCRHRVPCNTIFEATASALARGTLVRTADGPIAVEDLLPGDRIETSRGIQRLYWIGSTSLMPGAAGAGSSLTHLIRVMADSFGPGRPENDVVLGPGARLLRASEDAAGGATGQGILHDVRNFVDGNSLIALTPPSPVQLYHLAFVEHATFSAGGLDIESYHPGTDLSRRLGESSRALLLSLFPYLRDLGSFGPLNIARATELVEANSNAA